MRRLHPALASAAALLVIALAGCSPEGPAYGGPLRIGSDTNHAEVCVTSQGSPTGKVIVGDSFVVEGSTRAVIQKISLRSPKNLNAEHVYLIPYRKGEDLVGADDYPPKITDSWYRREEAVGATAAPHRRIAIAVVLELPDQTKVGTTAGLTVTYTVSGTRYVKHNSIAFRMQRSPCE